MEANIYIQWIRGDRDQRSRAIRYIFEDQELRQSVKAYVFKNGGSGDDAQLLFDDMITQFVKMVFRKSDLEISSSLHAYLFGIARMLWKQEIRKKKVHQRYVEHQEGAITEHHNEIESELLSKEKIEMLNRLLKIVGEKCRSVLIRWAYGYSMKEIAKAEGYKSDMMARKKKSKCLKALKSHISQHPQIIQMFAT